MTGIGIGVGFILCGIILFVEDGKDADHWPLALALGMIGLGIIAGSAIVLLTS